MLIASAELQSGDIADVRIKDGYIAGIGRFEPEPGETVVAADGCLLTPGLHDHHIHFAALAASLASVQCGPPTVTSTTSLASTLALPGDGWLRGIGYHESVAGLLDRDTLDRLAPGRPVRVQHRSGRMWFLNTPALERLLECHAPPPGLERMEGRYTGRLFDEDTWLRQALASSPPNLAPASAMLARVGVTGVTDMSPGNDAAAATYLASESARGALSQKVLLAGKLAFNVGPSLPGMRIGPAKLHLHEADLPPFETAISFVRDAHRQGRAVAVHCATELELVFALAAIDTAGVAPGDRIEHASVTPDTAVAEIARLGIAVVSQPHFIFERGDRYRLDVPLKDQAILYRLRAFLNAGVSLAGGSDAPFGGTSPWKAMAAAVSRRTLDGVQIGGSEAITAEEALDLYLRVPDDLTRRRTLTVGATADLCLVDRPWAIARTDLSVVQVLGTWVDGRTTFDGIDQTPLQRRRRADAAARQDQQRCALPTDPAEHRDAATGSRY
jgi:predicted amidohydrolase YtcJ